MLFTTPAFIGFLIVVFALYWQLERRGQNLLIVVASFWFYAWWDWRFLGLVVAIAGTDFIVARGMAQTEDRRRRRALLAISLVSNLGALAFFKYFNFFVASFRELLAGFGLHSDSWTLQLILPLGISFYTFQALSYTIDVYRGELEAVDDVVEYFAFITFFPHMVAGPIQRAVHLLRQFGERRTFDYAQAVDGSRQMLWGFFKKMVVADNLAGLVDAAYAEPLAASGWQLLWATYAFSLQIYCDFSGYTDIAIGCSRLFGLNLTRNFAYPYFSPSITEFWRRWHISLSTWFREYLYIPLGGNRRGWARTRLNMLIVFVVSGFWHGANWTFIVWGLLHGLYYLVDPGGWRDRRQAPPAPGRHQPREAYGIGYPARVFITYQAVCFAWIFFRAESVTHAGTIIRRIASDVVSAPFELPVGGRFYVYAAAMLLLEWLHREREHGLDVRNWAPVARWTTYYAVAAAIILFASVDLVPFIYFQF